MRLRPWLGLAGYHGAVLFHRHPATDMLALLPDWPRLAAFLLASLALALTPGSGVIYIVARALAHGRRAGLVSVAGVALGNLGNAIAASLGLAALLALSPLAFGLVKYAGALYLVYLGLRMLGGNTPTVAASPAVTPSRRLFREGLIVALLNPKTALFFAAFLPQFIEPGANANARSLALGALFVAIAAVTDSLYALAAAGIAGGGLAPGKSHRLGQWLGGSACILLGIYGALSDPGLAG